MITATVIGGVAVAQSTDLVVATDGSGDYASIQAAVDAATDGDRIVIKQGTYVEAVDIRKDVTLIAPQGAMVTNTSAVNRSAGLLIHGDAEPEVRGLTITGWTYGVSAARTDGAWTVANVTITDAGRHGMALDQATGQWTVQDTTIRTIEGYGIDAFQTVDGRIRNVTIIDAGSGINLYETTGDWMVTDSQIEQVDEDGINTGAGGNGDWLIADTVVRQAGDTGIAGDNHDMGSPVVRNVTVDSVTDGMTFYDASANLTVTDATITNVTDSGLSVSGADGAWTVEDITVRNASDHGIDAYQATGGQVRNATITDARRGINLYATGGDWTVANTVIKRVDENGIDAGNGTTGTPLVRNVTIKKADRGLSFVASEADWTVTTTTVTGTTNASVVATETTGAWTLTASSFPDGTGVAVNATSAAVTGNASYNYWGATDGPSGDFNGSGGAAIGNLVVEPYYADTGQTTLGSSTDAGPTITTASDLPGSGTTADPYLVHNATALGVIETDLGARYALGADVDASALAAGAGFEPIGTQASPFTGTFDGRNHTINGLTIDRPGSDNVGLFGYTDSAIIRDVHLRNVSISGRRQVGGLIGWNVGTVRNVSVEGQVNGTANVGVVAGQNSDLVTKASAAGRANGTEVVGGLVGLNFELQSTISESYATARVNGSEDVGGLVGVNVAHTVVERSYATGRVTGTDSVGGLVGRNVRAAEITQTYAAGAVRGTTDVGGLVGTTGDGATVTASYWDTEASGQSRSAGNATGLQTSAMTGTAAETNMTGLAFGNEWTTTDRYPALTWQPGAETPKAGDPLVARFGGEDGRVGNLDVLQAVNAANSGGTIGGEPVTNLDILQLVNRANQ
ncbi:right-handed parallel beta-helix repeat-containing protein [Haloplanus ruber]|uniref:Right-handed parallel beta-helix repeat-containing protein n=2 Tax=Haloplanus ruber TaxID=869892 RepID=A0ABD6D5D4_9EURY